MIPTYIIVCMCTSSCSIDKEKCALSFSIDKIKNKKKRIMHSSLYTTVLETYLIFFWPNIESIFIKKILKPGTIFID